MLEDELVELRSFRRFPRKPQYGEHIRQPLDAQSNRSVAHVGPFRLHRRVVVHVNHPIEIAHHRTDTLTQTLEIIDVSQGGFLDHECRKSNGCQVTHRRLIGRRVLDDLRTEVGRLDGPQILLVGFPVGRVLVEEIGRPSLHLRIEDLEPELPG